jgi:hypothetical protein
MVNTDASNRWDRPYTETVIMGSHVLYADGRLAALSIENHHAARFWSVDTKWCIESKSWFEDYRESGRLILFRMLNEDRRYLLSPSCLEFRNTRNRGLSMKAFIERFPRIEATVRSIMADDWRALFYFELVRSDMRFEHSLNLTALRIASLPPRLTVRDDLVLSHNPIAELPDGLVVGGDLDIRDTCISGIPESARIAGRTIT